MIDHCAERESVFALAHGMLSGREEMRAKLHLNDCADCRRVFQGYQKLDAVLDGWMSPVESSPGFEARVRAAVAAAETSRARRSFWDLAWANWMLAPALASVLVVAGVVGLRGIRTHPASRVQEAHLAAPAEQPPAVQAAAQEVTMYRDLRVLEDYDMLSNFDVISELPKGNNKVAN